MKGEMTMYRPIEVMKNFWSNLEIGDEFYIVDAIDDIMKMPESSLFTRKKLYICLQGHLRQLRKKGVVSTSGTRGQFCYKKLGEYQSRREYNPEVTNRVKSRGTIVTSTEAGESLFALISDLKMKVKEQEVKLTSCHRDLADLVACKTKLERQLMTLKDRTISKVNNSINFKTGEIAR
jgi:hypothetical protein